ncbi:MAG TPA: ATP-dependent DNA helicase [Steroidobacteraceae bacterium]|nr:ATP-dependent DNA helicase [Steroidobacteraceae bacterium]
MAQRVADALGDRRSLVIEAGTGTGKTFGYLVPVLLSGLRVLVSTGTRTLQDQLYDKDLPLLGGALGMPVDVAVLKGRGNYLCVHRLGQVQLQQALRSGVDPDAGLLERIRTWAARTGTGDLSEVTDFADSHPLWPQITSTRDNCLGPRCPEYSRCHLVKARREALEAQVVIINHHLMLADLTLKEDGFGDVLGTADAVVIDEAHQLPDLAMQFFGARCSARGLTHLLGAARTENTPATGLKFALSAVDEAMGALNAAVPARTGRTPWEECPPELTERTGELAHAVAALAGELEALPEDTPAKGLLGRVTEMAAQLHRIAQVAEIEGARSAERTPRGFVLHLLPFEIANRFQAQMQAHRSAWIFTSATLSVGEDFSHFTSRLGLAEAETVRIPSPFDFERQSLLWLPEGLPEPAASEFVHALLEASLPLIDAARGGAFILFTSHRALAEAAMRLRALWSAAGRRYRLFVQGEAPREQLLRGFRDDGDAVLLGTASFWEGVDVKGTALRLVIIEKLPFASPDDPIVKARVEHIQRQGGNPFKDYQLQEAALTLRQGVGRLIRSEADFGVVMIADRRLRTRPYGRTLLAALPPMRRARDLAEVTQFLKRHAPRPLREAAS